jgi:hypothetical protein
MDSFCSPSPLNIITVVTLIFNTALSLEGNFTSLQAHFCTRVCVRACVGVNVYARVYICVNKDASPSIAIFAQITLRFKKTIFKSFTKFN